MALLDVLVELEALIVRTLDIPNISTSDRYNCYF